MRGDSAFSIEFDHGSRSARLIGELDLEAYERALEQLLSAFPKPGDVTLDLSELTFIDSTGIRLLVQLRRALDDSDRIVLRSPTAPVRKVLEAVGVVDLGFELNE